MSDRCQLICPSLLKSETLHVGVELAQCLVEVVHLREDADYNNDSKDICRRMRELVVAAQRKLERNSKALDCHDGDGADGRADADIDHRVLLAIHGRNLVNHDQCEYRHDRNICQEACEQGDVSSDILHSRTSIPLT